MILDITETRGLINRIDEKLSNDPVIFVTRHGKRVYAITSIEFIKTLEDAVEILSDPDARAVFLDAIKDIRAKESRDGR